MLTLAANTPSRFLALLCATLLLALTVPTPTARAQGNDNYDAERARAMQLYKETRFTEALPIFEKLAAARPTDRDVIELLGHLILTSTINVRDPEARRKGRARGRSYLQRAKDMGSDNPLLNEVLATVPVDGSGDVNFSNRKEVDEAMREGEAAFASGDFAKAIAAYERALKIEPRLYEAALFTGDVYYKKGDHAKAAEWFARAVSIDPDRETAYRYWGDSLMRQGKMAEARDKFVEAFISDPYSRLARAGLIEWANQNQIRPAHPKIDIPANVTSSGDGNVNITLDPNLGKGKDDGSAAWLMYGISRALWVQGKDGMGEKFRKQFPNATAYRHSLAEEIDALSMVVNSVKEQMKEKKVKTLEPSLAALVKLSDAGLLEPYILLARADQGIAQDYPAYLKAHRDKLRRYAVEYVLTGGGN